MHLSHADGGRPSAGAITMVGGFDGLTAVGRRDRDAAYLANGASLPRFQRAKACGKLGYKRVNSKAE